MTDTPIRHGALAVMPKAGQLVAARRRFDDARTPVDHKIEAAQVMVALGGAFDTGRARAWLRDQGMRA